MDLKHVLMLAHKLIFALVLAIEHVRIIGILSEMMLGTCMVAIMFVQLEFRFELLSYSFCLLLLIIAMVNKRAPLLRELYEVRSQVLHGESYVSCPLPVSISISLR